MCCLIPSPRPLCPPPPMVVSPHSQGFQTHFFVSLPSLVSACSSSARLSQPFPVPSSPTSLHPSLHYFPFSPPPAEKVTPRHKHPPSSPVSRLFLCLSFSVCLTLFQSFQPYFLTRVSTAPPFIFCPLLGFALSFWIFSCAPHPTLSPLFHFLYPLCIISIILTPPNFHNTIFSCCHASQALFSTDL